MGLNPNQALSQLPNSSSNQQQQKQHPRLNCPRCDSTNTKFCYYNNYSKLQPRHYCRTCKRHWTAGGTLRNVPIGRATRKCKRQKTTHNDDTSHDINDQKVSVPFDGDIDASIFPDILKQVLFQPQIPPLMSAPEDFYTGCSSSNSSSYSSIYSFYGEEKYMMNLMNGYGKGPIRGQDSLVQSGSYWNCWDGMTEFDAPNESQKL